MLFTLDANLPSTVSPSTASNEAVSFRLGRQCDVVFNKLGVASLIAYYSPSCDKIPHCSKELPFHIERDQSRSTPIVSAHSGTIPLIAWPYIEIIRLEKPTGSLLMFWPFAWGLTMAAYKTHLPLDVYFTYLIQFAIYAIILRGSACTVNDILDVDYDVAVERTKCRPLPSGRISTHSAIAFLFLQYILAITFLVLTLPNLGRALALAQLLPVFAVYPLLKRITYWPQAWLGVAMNLGFPVAWATITGSFDCRIIIPALVGCWCWTMLYDTIYACQDIRDDVKAGVRSTAILFGQWIGPLLVLCGLLFLNMLIIVGYLNGHGLLYYIITVGGTTAHLLMQCMTVDISDPKSCWRNFNHNGRLGVIIWMGILFDYYKLNGYSAFVWYKSFVETS